MRKNTIKMTLLAIAIAGTVLALGSRRAASNSPCEESMEQCCKKKSRESDANIWESGTGQFFSSTGLN